MPLAAAYINSGDTRTDGIELEAKLKFGQRTDLQFAATYQEGHYINGGWYYFGGTSASQRYPGKTVHVRNIPKSAINARLNLHWFDHRLTTYIEANRTGRIWRDVTTYEMPLTTVGLGAHLRLPYDLTLSFGLNDLFNKGPQQKLKGPDHRHAYSHCDSTDIIYCLFGGGTKQYTELHAMEYNVQYPQQGRTWYASLGWKF